MDQKIYIGISISVETLGEDKDKFLVQVVSHASKEGAKTGSKIVSILDSQLHTMEENRTEYITKKELTKERRSYMTICEKGYYNKVTRVCGERDTVKRFYHSFQDSRNFILEGANIVLLRYFGISRYRGTIKTDCVLMDGTICESIYVSIHMGSERRWSVIGWVTENLLSRAPPCHREGLCPSSGDINRLLMMMMIALLGFAFCQI
ncbi:hypothetical protein evm_008518 [Chilo suppressalis]|nr:hypothetical protein evm_008518 [Chilo suppressalis]